MELYLEICKSLELKVSDAIPNFTPFVACGGGEEPRDYIATWEFDCNGDNVEIYLSELLKDKEKLILSTLEPFLLKAKSCHDLRNCLPVKLSLI